MDYTTLKKFKELYADKYALFVTDFGVDADAAFSRWAIANTPEGSELRSEFVSKMYGE